MIGDYIGVVNLKELRPSSGKSSAIRILFAFDPKRRAILLVGGDKAGAWEQWYREQVPIADSRLDTWLDHLGRQDYE